MAEICCKVDIGIKRVQLDCDSKIDPGAIDLRVIARCQIASFATAAEPDVEINEIILVVPGASPPIEPFVRLATKAKFLKHDFDHTFDQENNNITHNELIQGQIEVRNAAAYLALEKMLGKEVVVALKEKGENGKWRIIGIDGELFVNQVTGSTGEKTGDNIDTTLVISGDALSRWLYYFDTTQTQSDAEMDVITEVL